MISREQRRAGHYRSRGERRIGDFLEEAGLPFRYEAPLLIESRGKQRIWYPDFYLPDYHHVIEYFGVVGDPDYDDLKRKKATAYRENRIPAIFLEPGDLETRWQEQVLGEIEENLASSLGEVEDLKRDYEVARRKKEAKGPVFLK